jgi:hypothetical protein
MGPAALSFRFMGVVAVMFAAATRDLAVAALRIVGRRLVDVKRLPGVLMRCARAALTNA